MSEKDKKNPEGGDFKYDRDVMKTLTNEQIKKIGEELDRDLLRQFSNNSLLGKGAFTAEVPSAFRTYYEYGHKTMPISTPLFTSASGPKDHLRSAGVPEAILLALYNMPLWDWSKLGEFEKKTKVFKFSLEGGMTEKDFSFGDACSLADMFDPLGLDLFQVIPLPDGCDAKFPLDFYTPDDDRPCATVIPAGGAIPAPILSGDEVYVPTYKVGNAVNWGTGYARDNRFDILAKASELFVTGFKNKVKDEQLSLLTHAGASESDKVMSPAGIDEFLGLTELRDVTVTDVLCEPEMMSLVRRAYVEKHVVQILHGDPGVGFTPEYQEICNRKSLTVDDITYHLVTDVSEQAREQGLIKSPAKPTIKRRILEFFSKKAKAERESQEDRQSRVCIGIDRNKSDNSLVMPIRKDLHCFSDPEAGRAEDKQGMYGWVEYGLASLGKSCVVLSHEFDPSVMAEVARPSKIARLKNICGRVWNWDPMTLLRS